MLGEERPYLAISTDETLGQTPWQIRRKLVFEDYRYSAIHQNSMYSKRPA